MSSAAPSRLALPAAAATQPALPQFASACLPAVAPHLHHVWFHGHEGNGLGQVRSYTEILPAAATTPCVTYAPCTSVLTWTGGKSNSLFVPGA
jgi:hypothetical protein